MHTTIVLMVSYYEAIVMHLNNCYYREYLLCVVADLCSITNATVINIDHFNALNINTTSWQFTCNNGYKLIGPSEFNCIENASYYLNDNCQG